MMENINTFQYWEEMRKQKEKIVCAAISYNEIIICGLRHVDCFDTLSKLLNKYTPITDLQTKENKGFLTSFNRFVDRKEAYRIAIESHQITHTLFDGIEEGKLISEDLY